MLSAADLHRISTASGTTPADRLLIRWYMSAAAPALARTILVVEDEASIAEAVATRLRSEGFAVAIAADGPSGVERCRALQPDLVVLDLMLPGLDGLEVCREIQRDRPVPVLMLTARDSETDLVVGLAVGADDYLTKPFSARELVARVHALLRRVERRPGARRAPERWCSARSPIDLEARRVQLDDELVHLTPTEFDLLAYLAAPPARVSSPASSCSPRSGATTTAPAPAPSTPTCARCAASSATTSSARCTASATRPANRTAEASTRRDPSRTSRPPARRRPVDQAQARLRDRRRGRGHRLRVLGADQDRRVAVGQRRHRRRGRDGHGVVPRRGA